MKRFLFSCGLILSTASTHDIFAAKVKLPLGIRAASPDCLTPHRRWRTVDLRKKENQLMNHQGHEIARYLLDGVKKGELTPYADGQLTAVLTPAEVQAHMVSHTHKPDDDDDDDDEAWGNAPRKKPGKKREPIVEHFPYRQVSHLELMESRYYDVKRGKHRSDIVTLTLIIPATHFANGIRRDVASFSLVDVMNYFDKINAQAMWYNESGQLKCLKLSTIFTQRLFFASVARIENSADAALEDHYTSPQTLAMASQEMDNVLRAREAELFSPKPLH